MQTKLKETNNPKPRIEKGSGNVSNIGYYCIMSSPTASLHRTTESTIINAQNRFSSSDENNEWIPGIKLSGPRMNGLKLLMDTTNKSTETLSKDWIEKIASSLDNKIELEKVKNDAKFDKLLSQSNERFDRMFAELKFESERNSLKIEENTQKLEASIAKSETNLTRWMVTILISLISIVVAIILAIWKLEPAIEPIPPETNHLTRSINQTAESVQDPKTSDQDKTE